MSRKPLGHFTIWIESLMAAIPVGIAFEWKNIQKHFFNRTPHFTERFLIVMLGTALTLYVFSYIFKVV